MTVLALSDRPRSALDLRWKARILAVFLVLFSWSFFTYRHWFVDRQFNGPRPEFAVEIAPLPTPILPMEAASADEGDWSLKRHHGRFPAYECFCLEEEIMFVLGSTTTALGLVIWSLVPARRERRRPFHPTP